jgi:cholestenol delta-isomerase
MNGFWIVIPGWLVIQSTMESAKAFRVAQGTGKVKEL